MAMERKPDFEGLVSSCEILLCGDNGSEVRFILDGKEERLRVSWASFRLLPGERVRAYGPRGSLSRVEVVDQNDKVTFLWHTPRS